MHRVHLTDPIYQKHNDLAADPIGQLCLRKLVYPQIYPACGVYYVKFRSFGQWYFVLVDSLLQWPNDVEFMHDTSSFLFPILHMGIAKSMCRRHPQEPDHQAQETQGKDR